MDSVREITSGGGRAIYGDATHRDTLEQAGLRDAVTLVLSSSNMHGTSELIRVAKELNPRVLIFARSTYLREHRALREAGAGVVFSGGGGGCPSVTEVFFREVRGTPEQIDRERGSVRAGGFRGAPAGEAPP